MIKKSRFTEQKYKKHTFKDLKDLLKKKRKVKQTFYLEFF